MFIFEYLKLAYYLVHPHTIFIKSRSNAMGDNLLQTLVIPHLKSKSPEQKIIVESKHKDLFYNNPDIYWVTDKHIKTTSKFLKTKYTIMPEYNKPIYLQLMEFVGFDFESYPILYLTDNELSAIKTEFDFEYIAICPFGKQQYSGNRKEWGFDKFQRVIYAIPNIKFVQIGVSNDKLLDDVIDARGKRIRESAAIIKNSLFFIGLEGGLMHLTKAVGQRAVIIYGGLVSLESSAYSENINIANPIFCSPCFTTKHKLEDCPTMECMKGIDPQEVIDRVVELLNSLCPNGDK
jgi:ADP-heptose:LPS heptosyltransferase